MTFFLRLFFIAIAVITFAYFGILGLGWLARLIDTNDTAAAIAALCFVIVLVVTLTVKAK